MQIDFAVLADHALIDQQGKLSVIGIFQVVHVTRFPAMHPRAHLVLRVSGRRTEIGDHPVRIRFVGPDGAEVFGGQGSVRFGEPPAGVTTVEAAAVLVFDVPFSRPGSYHFEITLDDGPALHLPVIAVPRSTD